MKRDVKSFAQKCHTQSDCLIQIAHKNQCFFLPKCNWTVTLTLCKEQNMLSLHQIAIAKPTIDRWLTKVAIDLELLIGSWLAIDWLTLIKGDI